MSTTFCTMFCVWKSFLLDGSRICLRVDQQHFWKITFQKYLGLFKGNFVIFLFTFYDTRWKWIHLYIIFQTLKKWLATRRFITNDEGKTKKNAYFQILDKSHYTEGIKKFESHWSKCMTVKKRNIIFFFY